MIHPPRIAKLLSVGQHKLVMRKIKACKVCQRNLIPDHFEFLFEKEPGREIT